MWVVLFFCVHYGIKISSKNVLLKCFTGHPSKAECLAIILELGAPDSRTGVYYARVDEPGLKELNRYPAQARQSVEICRDLHQSLFGTSIL